MEDLSFEEAKNEWTEDIRNKSTSLNRSNVDTRVLPSGYMINDKVRRLLPRILDFEVYPDDVWVLSFPKCGTTWTQEMIWLLVNNLDYEKAKEIPIRARFPFLELEAIVDEISDGEVYPPTIDLAANTPRPRTIKSHLPPCLLPKQLWTVKPKLVYVSRNPQDAVISYYHHHRLWNGYTGTLEEFFNAFVNDSVVYSPYWSHVLDFCKIREKDHFLFNTFEEMKRDLPAVVKRTANFLGVSLTEDQLSSLCHHLSFASMKENKSVNYSDVADEIKKQNNMADPKLKFMRSGEAGGWQKVLSSDMISRMEEWTTKHLEGTEFTKYPWS